MLILDKVCSDYGIAWIAKILKTVFQMIQIIGPVLAIISLAIIFFSSVTASDTKSFETNKKKIKNCLLALVITFFLPVFVNLVMSATFMKNTFEIGACWKSVENIKYGTGSYIKKDSGKSRTGTFIIDPSQYKGTDGNPNETGGSSGVNSTNLSSAFVNLAVSQLNDPSAKGGKKYWQYLGFKSHVAWCTEFVTWNIYHTEYNGQKLSSILNKKCAASTCWVDFCKKNSKTTFHKRGHVPKEGDLMFFSYKGNSSSHIGIVRSSDGKKIYTIEGNVGDRVKKRTIMVNDRYIYGFCSWY